LGILIGPAVGGVILIALGPAPGIMLNTVFYLPLVLWLVRAPYGPRYRTGIPAPRRAVRGFGDIVQTVQDIKPHAVIVSMTLLAADAAGAFLGGIVLESRGLLPPRPRTAIVLAMLWCAALASFSLAKSYPLALGFLFAAGFLELSFNAMAQSLVQINAPPDKRGRVIGLFNMASLGLRAFSGVSVGLLGSLIGVHWSLALSALATLAIAAGLLALP